MLLISLGRGIQLAAERRGSRCVKAAPGCPQGKVYLLNQITVLTGFYIFILFISISVFKLFRCPST